MTFFEGEDLGTQMTKFIEVKGYQFVLAQKCLKKIGGNWKIIGGGSIVAIYMMMHAKCMKKVVFFSWCFWGLCQGLH